MTRLQQLFDEQKQSPWLDNLRRGWVTGGELQQWVDRGVRGITSNPSIFQKAIEKAADYDDEFADSVEGGDSIEDAYWDLVTTDIRSALEPLGFGDAISVTSAERLCIATFARAAVLIIATCLVRVGL